MYVCNHVYNNYSLLVVLNCRVVELPPLEMKETDVCIKMLAAPINPSDINRIEGLFCISFSCC